MASVPNISVDDISPHEFEARYMAPNLPCVLSGVGSEWRACREWADQAGGARLDALRASTRGMGEVILAALESGATSLVIALGGSASTDAGTGALTALGLRLLNSDGQELTGGGGALANLSLVDSSALLSPPPRLA